MGDAPDSRPQLSDALEWTQRWSEIDAISSNAERTVVKARNAQGVIAFVKTLSPTAPENRRERMYREAEALQTNRILRVPRLIESNVQHVADKNYQLYIATTFIDGRPLNEAVDADDISPAAAVAVIRALCETVRQAHDLGIHHRDIKPDNIVIVGDGDDLVPFLVDFGIAHVDDSDRDFKTNRSEELGNRFVHLPEFYSGSENKRDPRSDITQCVAVLFYMLVKFKPSGLHDGTDSAPHQRRNAQIMLKGSRLNYDRLLGLFDRGFQGNINKRFQSIDELIEQLAGLSEDTNDDDDDGDSISARLQERLSRPSRRSLLANGKALLDLRNFAVQQVGVVLEKYGAAFRYSEGNANADNFQASIELLIIDVADPQNMFGVSLFAEVIGDELVLSLAGSDGSHRTFRVGPAERPGESFIAALETFVVRGLERVTSEQRFVTPRELPVSDFIDGMRQGSVNAYPRRADSIEIEPRLQIEWFLPRIVNGTHRISWRLTNIGNGDARDLDVFMCGIDYYRLPALRRGEALLEERRFDNRSAYHDIIKAGHQTIIEFADCEDNLYRQMAEVHAAPIYKGRAADYLTTQLEMPLLIAERHLKPDADGVDSFRSDGPLRWAEPEL